MMIMKKLNYLDNKLNLYINIFATWQISFYKFLYDTIHC